MVHELADYERAPEQCHLTGEQLRAALFGPSPALFGHVAADSSGEPVGFALWFLNFSTWAGGHGIYLEDLYVRPALRGSGAGRALMAALAAVCVERGYQRLDWSMLDWNPAARFYAAIGATQLQEWVSYRLAGPALDALAAELTGPPAAGATLTARPEPGTGRVPDRGDAA
ncbi:GNAT family N-acetyltransferase [Micromonospora mirobrigensis]|nr:GNAT family N-acetyltransferase [Micromonospora mirobrigensis]